MTLRLTGMVGGRRQGWNLDLPVMRLGRAAGNALVVADAFVSAEHAELVRQGDEWRIRDLGSRNGTWVNGVRIAGWTAIRPADLVEVGRICLLVEERVDSAPVGFAPDTGTWIPVESPRGPTLVFRPEDLSAAELAERAHAEARLLGIVAEAGRQLTRAHSEREAAEAVLDILSLVAGFSRLALLVRDQTADRLVPLAHRPAGDGTFGPLAVPPEMVQRVLDGQTAVVRSSESGRGIIMMAPLSEDGHGFGLVYGERGGRPGEHMVTEQSLFDVISRIGASKIANERMRQAESARRLSLQEIAEAAVIQRSELRPAPEGLAGWRFEADCEPCGGVGGDLYDFHLRADGRLVILLGDIVGKGLGAAMRMSSVLSAARIIYDLCDSPLRLVTWLDEHVRRSFDEVGFLTLFVGCLEPSSGRLHYVNAGQPALIGGPDGLRDLTVGGVPLGLGFGPPYEEGEDTVGPGESLLVVSDGVIEARHGDELFGSDRLRERFSTLVPLGDPKRIGRGIIGLVDEYLAGEPRSDDLTLIVAHRD